MCFLQIPHDIYSIKTMQKQYNKQLPSYTLTDFFYICLFLILDTATHLRAVEKGAVKDLESYKILFRTFQR